MSDQSPEMSNKSIVLGSSLVFTRSPSNSINDNNNNNNNDMMDSRLTSSESNIPAAIVDAEYDRRSRSISSSSSVDCYNVPGSSRLQQQQQQQCDMDGRSVMKSTSYHHHRRRRRLRYRHRQHGGESYVDRRKSRRYNYRRRWRHTNMHTIIATVLATTIVALITMIPSPNNAQRIGVVVASVTPDTGLAVAGNSTTDYSSEQQLLPNSNISNAYTDGGCLYQLMPGWTKKRVCTSNDSPEFIELGYCEQDGVFNYPEIRIASQNWESAFFETWIVQVILSEMLGVPTTVETGLPDVVVDLYDPDSRFEYGLIDDFECLERANDVGDCRLLDQSNTGVDGEYKSCCHFIPEVWDSDISKLEKLEEKDAIEAAAGVGTIGEQRWFVPKFTAIRDPTLLSYIGLAGEDNREKLANRFKRPTRWGDYCRQESSTNCTVPDKYAARPPHDEVEAQSFFSMPHYTGFFRYTSKNDCTMYPTVCTGHMMDYPCGWTSYVTAQKYHLDIALEPDGNEPGSNGYSYGEMVEIISAANATKSDLLFFWWSPEALLQEYSGTDMEFTPVVLPPVTKECLDNRIASMDSCSLDLSTRVGNPEGVCDEAPHPLQKLVARSLYQTTHSETIPEALTSPAYEVLQNFLISGPEMGELFDNWRANRDDPRTGVCEWIVDNFEKIESSIPRGFPRDVQEDSNPMQNGLSIAAGLCSTIAILMVVGACALTYEQRERRAIKLAQLEFLWVLLCGLFLVSIGSLLIAVPSEDEVCVATLWMINIGYSLELVPLIVKMAAFYRLMKAAKRLRHVKLTRQLLFGWVVGLTFLVVIFLALWTAIDPPRTSAEYHLTENDSTGGLDVTVTHFCQSNSQAWSYAAAGWHLVLLAAATIQAFQTRSIRKDINESHTLAIMIYSHVVFVILRVVVLLLHETISRTDLANALSLIFAFDVIATICIYFFPKFLSAKETKEEKSNDFLVESSTVRHLQMLAAIATRKHEAQIRSEELQFRSEQLQRSSPALGSIRLPDPTKHRELRKLRNMTSSTGKKREAPIIEGAAGTEEAMDTVSTRGDVPHTKCTHCGCNMHCPACEESEGLLSQSDVEESEHTA